MIAHNVFAALSVGLILLVRGTLGAATYDLIPPITAFSLGIVAILSRGWLQLAASVLLAILAVVFMFANLGIVAA